MPATYPTIYYYANLTDATNETNVLSAGANTGVLQTVDSHTSWRVPKVIDTIYFKIMPYENTLENLDDWVSDATPYSFKLARNDIYAEFIKRMIEKGKCSPNYENDFYETPLGCAIRAGAIENVKVLIAAGANVNHIYRDDGGVTHLDNAIEYAIRGIYNVRSDRMKKAIDKMKDIIDELVNAGAKVSEQNIKTARVMLEFDKSEESRLWSQEILRYT